MFWASFLLLLSFALIVAEVFFPSMGALGVGALICLASSIIFAFQEGSAEGYLMLTIAVGGGFGSVIAARRLLPKTAFGKKLFLIGEEPTPEQRRATDPANAALLGKTGVTESFLRPAGIAQIEGRRVDVASAGNPIPEGMTVRVVQIDGNRVVVEAVPSEKKVLGT